MGVHVRAELRDMLVRSLAAFKQPLNLMILCSNKSVLVLARTYEQT